MKNYKSTAITLSMGIIFLAFFSGKIFDKGFVPMFDGKTLNGWEGDPKYWRAENGEIVGEITPETIIKVNTFLIWKGGHPADFELTVSYRISSKGNSGVNYRSVRVDSLPYALKGYQADIDGKDKYNLGYPKYSGQNYEERGRQFLAQRGQITVIDKTGKVTQVDSTGTKEELLKAINYDGWNELHIIAKGNNMKHYLNGKLMSEVTDNDPAGRKFDGLIGVQVHQGPPMKIEYKDFMIKILK